MWSPVLPTPVSKQVNISLGMTGNKRHPLHTGGNSARGDGNSDRSLSNGMEKVQRVVTSAANKISLIDWGENCRCV